MQIRPAQHSDQGAIDIVVDAAFGQEGPAVVAMVHGIRDGEYADTARELVAEEDDRIVGYVGISSTPVRREDGGTTEVTMLTPLAVHPAAQGRGTGSALVQHILELAQQDGVPFVILEGSPAYYGRLGFQPIAPFGLVLPLPDWAAPEAAQIALLDPAADVPPGRVEYPPYVP